MIRMIVFVVLAVMLLLVVLDRLRKNKDRARLEEIQAKTKTADESGPTQTGKFRVQQMLEKTEQSKRRISEEPEFEGDDEDTPLPDPFSGKDG